jgi:hypothetical protein
MSLFTLHFSLFTLHYSLFTLHSSLFTFHSSLFTLHYLKSHVPIKPFEQLLNPFNKHACQGTINQPVIVRK